MLVMGVMEQKADTARGLRWKALRDRLSSGRQSNGPRTVSSTEAVLQEYFHVESLCGSQCYIEPCHLGTVPPNLAVPVLRGQLSEYLACFLVHSRCPFLLPRLQGRSSPPHFFYAGQRHFSGET